MPIQPFATMELVSSDREPESLVTLCGRPYGDLYPCLGKVVGGKMILPPHGKEFLHSTVSTFYMAR